MIAFKKDNSSLWNETHLSSDAPSFKNKIYINLFAVCLGKRIHA